MMAVEFSTVFYIFKVTTWYNHIVQSMSISVRNEMELLFIVISLACEQALLFGQAKQASQEHASEGPMLQILD